MNDTVIVYVTRTGNCRKLANDLGQLLNAPVHEIVDLSNRKGAFRYIQSGAQSSMKAATPIKDPDIPLEGVRKVVLVQPIWASNMCPPLRSWLNAHEKELQGTNLSVLASHKGSTPEKFRANIEKEFGHLSAFACIVENKSEAEKKAALKDFAARV